MISAATTTITTPPPPPYLTRSNSNTLPTRALSSSQFKTITTTTTNPIALNSLTTTTPTRRRCDCFDMYNELVPFTEAWYWQKKIVEERMRLVEQDADCSDTVIILQHHPVFTLGTGSSVENLNFDRNNPPYPLYQTERGGEVTYHGPGQLIMYPIINLRYHKMDLHWYLRALEEVVVRVLSSTFSVKASRIEGLTGVWVGDRKLAAVGIRVSRWITYHGIALNVSTDLAPFNCIIPCGIRDRKVGSIKGLLKESQPAAGPVTETISYHALDDQLIDITHKSLVKEFSEVFQLELCPQSVSRLKFPKDKL